MASYKIIVKNAKVILKTVTNAVLNITGIRDLLTGSGSVDSNTKIDWTLQHYTNTAANFTSINPTLLVGQVGIETDDLLTAPKYKIGDGVTSWNTLPYNSSGGGGLSGLTTNKVLKATSATTAGDSNITDDGTTVSINTKTSITQNTTGTGSKGLSVNFNTIGEVFYIDDNGELIYNANAGATFKGSNGIINVISNGGVNPYIIFKYANGANTSGYLSGNGNSLVIDTAALKVNAPSVTKNGVEVATVNDIPTVLPRKYFAYNNTTYSYTGTTASTILRTIYIPANSMNLNSTLELHAIFGKSGTAGTMNYAAYITTNPSVITGGSIVKINAFGAGYLQGGFVLRLTNKNSLNSQAVQLANSGANQYDSWHLTNFARTLLSIDFAVDQYIHIYSTLGNATDTAIIYDYQCYIDKN